MPTLEDAISLAAHAHRGQVYPSPEGEPFILHPLRVMLRCESEVERIVAVLHDIIEDTACTLGELREAGYQSEVLDAVECLTHRAGEEYDAYIERVVGHDIARRVKLADLSENLANSRRLYLLMPADETRQRIARYERAYQRLGAAARL